MPVSMCMRVCVKVWQVGETVDYTYYEKSGALELSDSSYCGREGGEDEGSCGEQNESKSVLLNLLR